MEYTQSFTKSFSHDTYLGIAINLVTLGTEENAIHAKGFKKHEITGEIMDDTHQSIV